jgi:nucleoside-diphosphate-sugar epimerase
MKNRIFLAGATGAIGRRLLPLLLGAGYDVIGMTRSQAKALAFRGRGTRIVVADVFDEDAVMRALDDARPDIVIHQLTDLSALADPASMTTAVTRNARIRSEGTRNLVHAALAAGVGRMIAQSIAWAYAPAQLPHAESDALDVQASEPRSITVGGVVALEEAVLHSPPLVGTVLRYGQLYGPGTGADMPRGAAPVHVDAAAYAALLAVQREAHGIYNIAERNADVLTDKARSELEWRDDMRLPKDAVAQIGV